MDIYGIYCDRDKKKGIEMHHQIPEPSNTGAKPDIREDNNA